jgi:hypothetical protein
MFNAFNHPSFGLPYTDPSQQSNFGQIATIGCDIASRHAGRYQTQLLATKNQRFNSVVDDLRGHKRQSIRD